MKNKNGLVLLLAGAAVGTVIGYNLHSTESYAIKKDETVLSEEQKEKICNQQLEPFRLRFGKDCSQKTIDNLYDGSLGTIVLKRNEVVEEYNCEPQKWVCALKNGKFEADFNKK